MSRPSASASLEAKILETLRALVPEIPSVGLLETVAPGTQKCEDPTSLQVRVYNFRQPNEATAAFTVAAEIRLNVEQAESANGGLFYTTHEKVALWLERVMLGDCCEELETAEAYIDGFQRNGDDKDFDTMTGEWFAVWDLTLSGRLKQEEEREDTNNG